MFDIDKLLSRFECNRRRFQELVELPQERFDQILAGARPSLAELRAIATALGVPVAHLASKAEKITHTGMLFRKSLAENENVPSQLLDALSGRVSDSIDLLEDSKRLFWADAFEPGDRKLADAEQMALKYRDIFFAGDYSSPLLTLPRIVVEDMNILLFVLKFNGVEGAAACISGHPFIFLAARFSPRMLFTLAHEVGHLLFDRKHMSDFAHLDSDAKGAKKHHHLPAIERFANAFATALLLPVEGVGRSLKTIRQVTKTADDAPLGDLDIILLSRIYGTSFHVAAIRCEGLDLLPRGGAKSLYDEICKRHKSPEKRGDSAGLPARFPIGFPSLQRRLLDAAVGKIKRGQLSIGKVAEMLGITIPDLMDENAPIPQ